ncbi:hypothetical protein K438DRAFT_1746992 [Mycena galopus ATCC 62051]|nr:hypothetical protein K438DRAFT_1746992 [Mycena galopus ATCC 62051]
MSGQLNGDDKMFATVRDAALIVWAGLVNGLRSGRRVRVSVPYRFLLEHGKLLRRLLVCVRNYVKSGGLLFRIECVRKSGASVGSPRILVGVNASTRARCCAVSHGLRKIERDEKETARRLESHSGHQGSDLWRGLRCYRTATSAEFELDHIGDEVTVYRRAGCCKRNIRIIRKVKAQTHGLKVPALLHRQRVRPSLFREICIFGIFGRFFDSSSACHASTALAA